MGCGYLLEDGYCKMRDSVTGDRVVCPKNNKMGCAEWQSEPALEMEEPCDVGEVVERLGTEAPKPEAPAEALARAHWDYVEEVLDVAGVDSDKINIIGFHYCTAFVHGYKHGIKAKEGK